MSPVVVSRGVLCVHCNCQQNHSLVGIQSSAGESGFAAFFVAVICKWVWLPVGAAAATAAASAAAAAAAWLPSIYTHNPLQSRSPDPGQGGSETGVGNCPF